MRHGECGDGRLQIGDCGSQEAAYRSREFTRRGASWAIVSRDCRHEVFQFAGWVLKRQPNIDAAVLGAGAAAIVGAGEKPIVAAGG